MTFYETVLLYFSTVGTAFLLIAGGWVKIRDWLKTKAAAKVEAAAAAAQAKEAEIEAEVQERLKKLQAETDAAPEAMATSTAGSVAATA
ncbi:DUF1378 family protein [Kosakonia oryziphila]|uniref:Uncharacterized protein n=1 Tax=Kosakonia oryziphila TaxID=1005667 RepID=A0A1C4G1J2_9ENTR|nr:DUF1378 family protein [Kosakonia oryziphila]SCC62057.1 Protein of unknown function [Kosakonia oryziphila]